MEAARGRRRDELLTAVPIDIARIVGSAWEHNSYAMLLVILQSLLIFFLLIFLFVCTVYADIVWRVN